MDLLVTEQDSDQEEAALWTAPVIAVQRQILPSLDE